MSGMFEMGGYEFYVWSSYALFVLALIWDFFAPRVRERRAWRAVKRRMQRESQRRAQAGQQTSAETP